MRALRGEVGVSIITHCQFQESGGGWVAQNGTEHCSPPTPKRMGLFCSHTDFLAKASCFTYYVPGRDFYGQRGRNLKHSLRKDWGAIPGLSRFPFLSPRAVPTLQGADKGSGQRDSSSNKSETCLGASFVKRPNLPRPFRLIADLQKLLRV